VASGEKLMVSEKNEQKWSYWPMEISIRTKV
jgi:hypothetical protein